MAHRETKDLVAEAENSVIKAIHGAGDVAGAIADATSHTLVRTLQSTRATGSELGGMIRDTLQGTIQAVAQVGGEVESAASSIMVGALRGAQQVGKASAEAVSASAAALVKGAADVGGDVGRTAKGRRIGRAEGGGRSELHRSGRGSRGRDEDDLGSEGHNHRAIPLGTTRGEEGIRRILQSVVRYGPRRRKPPGLLFDPGESLTRRLFRVALRTGRSRAPSRRSRYSSRGRNAASPR